MTKLGPSLTQAGFARFQAATMQHLSFSLTLACPLRCAHCMVATISPRKAKLATLPKETASRFASEMPDLQREGIRKISFTGGEPLLARVQLGLLSEAANAAGIATTVVTACHWAKTPEVAARTVTRFPAISDWHISSDIYHSDFLSPQHIVNAAEALAAAKKNVLIRIAVGREPCAEEAELVAWLERRVPRGTEFALQPVSPVGRAVEIGITPELSTSDLAPDTPCLTTGPLIRHDGALLPCCSGLSDQPQISPFATIDASRSGLLAAVRLWRGDPLLQLVRTLGFGFPALWAEEQLGHKPVSPAPSHPCDYCTSLWSNADVRAVVREMTSREKVQERIFEVHDHVLSTPRSEVL